MNNEKKALVIIVLILLVIVAAPLGVFVFIWSVNSLAEIGGAGFYIDHTVWNYWVSFCFLTVMKASASGSK